VDCRADPGLYVWPRLSILSRELPEFPDSGPIDPGPVGPSLSLVCQAADLRLCSALFFAGDHRRMAMNFLDFEQPIAELEAKIDELKFVSNDAEVNIGEEIGRLRAKSRALTTSIFSNLTQWQIAQLARHPQRPYTLDYINTILTDFQELHGDRMYADDHAIVGGPARLDGRPVMIVGQQKGRDTKERVRRNYGMPKPEGYRKALRLMHMAERFNMPLITFIDTSGAYPGVGAEERGQSEAIARNLFEMSALRVPIISVVIGEGGSGGALAIGVGDRLIMLQYSIYSVISPEGCAGILWRSADKKDLAAEAMGVSAERIAKLGGIVDEVIKEPLGGAHRDPQAMADGLKESLLRHLGELEAMSTDELLATRDKRLRSYGVFSES
jgi:acetyl-CoA carboxylase carboxyl transferase subunit alpha